MKLNGLTCLWGALLLSLANCQATGPQTQAPVWEGYRERSRQWQQLDRLFIQKELESLGREAPRPANYARGFGVEPNKSLEWFTTPDGQALAKSLLSFQTPSGGWSKRTRMGKTLRRAGQAFGVESNYIPTFDNEATTTQLRALARAHTATANPAYAEAFYKGLHLIFEAQYPNGGWPQTYPLVGGYHDHITYNDDVMLTIARLLRDIAQGEHEYAFVSDQARNQAKLRLNKAIQLIVLTQIKVNGQPSLWAAQYHAKSLVPAPARAYEMVALATAESAGVLKFLMELEAPKPKTVVAIHAGINWFRNHQIVGYTWHSGDAKLTRDQAALPIWPRFVDIGSHRPLFGDRDGSIHHDLSQVSEERRSSYAWFTHRPRQALIQYQSWQDAHPKDANLTLP